MSRVARIVVPGFPHHITQRGNRRADVFETDGDREAYLRFLKRYADKRGLAIWAYCLMSNHVHLVAVPKREASLGEALRDAHTMYASYFNARTEFSGHVWQGRFHSCPLDDDHLWASLRYVEMNPVRAGLVRHAEQYRWSSAAAHCGVLTDPVLARDLPCMDKMGDWADWLNQPGDEAYQTQCKHLRRQTHTGRPCGANEFLEQVEKLVQRPLKPAKRGRPFKNKS